MFIKHKQTHYGAGLVAAAWRAPTEAALGNVDDRTTTGLARGGVWRTSRRAWSFLRGD